MIRRVLAPLLLCAIAPAAHAWGRAGHAAIARLAQANLTGEAQAELRVLLADDLDARNRPSGRKSLAAISSWLDEIRDEAVKTDPLAYKGWHVRSNSVCRERLGPCPDGLCVDQLLIREVAVLGDRSQTLRRRNEALKWVVHLVGDLHQPLHSGINANGGQARVEMPGIELKPDATLHKVWDTELAEAALRGWTSSARLSAEAPPATDGPTAWMVETREVARHDVYEALPGFSCATRLREPIVLDEAYRQHSLPVIRRQIERAGLRLARLLNTALSDPR